MKKAIKPISFDSSCVRAKMRNTFLFLVKNIDKFLNIVIYLESIFSLSLHHDYVPTTHEINEQTIWFYTYIYMYRPIPQSVIVSTRSNGFRIYSLSSSYNFLHRLPSVKYFNTLKANNRDESSAGCVMGWDSLTGLYMYLLHQ